MTSQRDPAIHQAWVRWVLRRILLMPEAAIARPEGDLSRLAVAVPEHRETLAPDLVIVEPGRKHPRVLVLVTPPGQVLDRPPPGARWKEPLTTRMMALLHGTGVRLGLVTNGEQWMLVDAPRGETTSFVTWPPPEIHITSHMKRERVKKDKASAGFGAKASWFVADPHDRPRGRRESSHGATRARALILVRVWWPDCPRNRWGVKASMAY